ncbi:hypothetical protein GGE45_004419 [Rhizobium aethiopicum]|uniref:Uncharacterized protein n=1 Tax=Rhizobium aethiopicum TaxID=1138170 RepID=A0A7W6MGR0_9HYPH|nr:hypothetical protein [Rhizobium aethiopicum]MBB4582064.1 hypothetical protein [Rhizobium aethiopicum]
MKQTGEVYQAKSAEGNARKGENCMSEGCHGWLVRPIQDPSPTPPHKGEGLCAAPSHDKHQRFCG